MKKISRSDAVRIQQLEKDLGSRLVRTVLTDPGKRLMRPERLEHLTSGTGKLSPDEERLLTRLAANRQSVKRLSEKKTSDERHGKKRREFKVNRSIRDWVQQGKERDAPRPTSDEGKEKEQKAIRGLRFLGVDPSEKTYYVRKVARA